MPLCDVLYARDDACVQVEVCVCIRGRSYMMYCGANDILSTLRPNSFFQKNTKQNTLFMQIPIHTVGKMYSLKPQTLSVCVLVGYSVSCLLFFCVGSSMSECSL